MEKHIFISIVGTLGICIGGFIGVSYATSMSPVVSSSIQIYMRFIERGSEGLSEEGKRVYYSDFRDIFQGVANELSKKVSQGTTPGATPTNPNNPTNPTNPNNPTNPTAPNQDYSFSPRCGGNFDSSGNAIAINLGSFVGTIGTNSFSSSDFSPTAICAFPQGMIPRFSSNMGIDFVDASLDIKGTSGTFKWRCYGAGRDGKPDTSNAIDCSAKKVIDAQCGPYSGTEKEKFDELEEGIGGVLPQSVKDNYCKVGWAVQGIDTRALNERDLTQFSWICRSKDNFAKTCKAKVKPYKIGLGACILTNSTTLRLKSDGNYDGNTLGSTMSTLGIGNEYAKCVNGCDFAKQSNLKNTTSPLFCYYEGMLAKDYAKMKVYDLRGRISPVTNVNTPTNPTSPTTPQQVYCLGGTDRRNSPDGQNECYFSWSQTRAGQAAIASAPSGGGQLTGSCGSDGAWKNWDLFCPNKTTVKTCTGGGRTFASADGSNSCTVSYIQANVGQSLTLGNGINDDQGKGVFGSASCISENKWTFDVKCPNLAGQSCSTGYLEVQSSDGKKTCEGAYPGKNVGESVSNLSLSNNGKISAKCGTDGNWTNITYTCPN